MNIVENKQLFIDQATALIYGEENLVTNLSNLSALYKEYLPNTNWVGFYLLDEKNNNLVLGPFQGKVACTRIPFNKKQSVSVIFLNFFQFFLLGKLLNTFSIFSTSTIFL